jgi:hypothetical protein
MFSQQVVYRKGSTRNKINSSSTVLANKREGGVETIIFFIAYG